MEEREKEEEKEEEGRVVLWCLYACPNREGSFCFAAQVSVWKAGTEE